MENLYDMLNDAKVDYNEYNDDTLNDIEIKQISKRVKNSIRKRDKSVVNKIAFVLVLISSVFFLFSSNIIAFADIPLIGTAIEDFMNANNKSLSEYKTILGEANTDNGITVRLNEILLDDNQIIISSTFFSDKVKLSEASVSFPQLYINGKDVMEKGGGGGFKVKKINNSTYTFFASINTNKMILKGNLNMKVIYNDIWIDNETKIEGNWSFNFVANKDKLMGEIKTIPINKKITLDNGQVVTIGNIRVSQATTTLNYTMELPNGKDITNGEGKYDVLFHVKDQTGKLLRMNSGVTMIAHNFLRYEALDNNITKLQITPYLISGYEGEKKENFHLVLEKESFEITIK